MVLGVCAGVAGGRGYLEGSFLRAPALKDEWKVFGIVCAPQASSGGLKVYFAHESAI